MKTNKHIRLLILWSLMAAVLLLGGCREPSPPSASLSSGQEKTAFSPALPSTRNLKVHFIDVGQGDSILAESEGHYMLIDAGENDRGAAVVTYLKNAGVTSLDYVIGTHPHSDHIGGLDDVLREFPTEKVILPPVEHTTKTFSDVLDVIADKGMKITMPKVGDTYTLGAAAFQILAPAGDYGDDLNNWSVGIRLSYKNIHLVMCGDAEKEAESDIVKYNKDLQADVLKAGHHGSSTSTSDELLDAVSPTYAVIQCGEDNSYGHPHKETLEKLERRGIQVFRTDQDGAIVADCDGSNITWIAKGEASSGNWSGDEAEIEAEGEAFAQSYVLNTNSKKFHLPSCRSVDDMKESNRQDVTENRDTLIEMGYAPCRQCSP